MIFNEIPGKEMITDLLMSGKRVIEINKHKVRLRCVIKSYFKCKWCSSDQIFYASMSKEEKIPCDFMILYIKPMQQYYIIPADEFNKFKSKTIKIPNPALDHQYSQYLEAWNLLTINAKG